MNLAANKPHDFQLCVCLNIDTKEVAVCGYSAKTQRFLNLGDLEKCEFIATHWIEYPEQKGTLI